MVNLISKMVSQKGLRADESDTRFAHFYRKNLAHLYVNKSMKDVFRKCIKVYYSNIPE